MKTRVQGNQAHISTGDATYTKRITKGVSRRSFGSGTRDSSAAWTDEELPLLRLRAPLEELDKACLLIAVFDHDTWKSDDPLGVVCIPLGRTAASVQHTMDPLADDQYTIDVQRQDICLGHATNGIGKMCCSLTVSGGTAAASAKLAAHAERVGAKVHRARWGLLSFLALLGRRGGKAPVAGSSSTSSSRTSTVPAGTPLPSFGGTMRNSRVRVSRISRVDPMGRAEPITAAHLVEAVEAEMPPPNSDGSPTQKV